MDLSYEEFEANLKQVGERIGEACSRAARNHAEVTLLPVTKNHPAGAADYAWRSGLAAVGENRVQEALEKMPQGSPELRWELIGPLQSNKAKRAAESFARIQTVDREKIVAALDRHASSAGRTLHVLLQVNAGDDPAKAGVSVSEAPRLLERALKAEALAVDGLMTIAPLDDDADIARRCFACLRQCRDQLAQDFGVPLSELSMGMSGDLAEAIAEGSTMVRIGTALFGKRSY